MAGFYKYAVKEELPGRSLQRTSAVPAGLRIAPRRWKAWAMTMSGAPNWRIGNGVAGITGRVTVPWQGSSILQ
jgi:hypothetical protein